MLESGSRPAPFQPQSTVIFGKGLSRNVDGSCQKLTKEGNGSKKEVGIAPSLSFLSLLSLLSLSSKGLTWVAAGWARPIEPWSRPAIFAFHPRGVGVFLWARYPCKILFRWATIPSSPSFTTSAHIFGEHSSEPGCAGTWTDHSPGNSTGQLKRRILFNEFSN